MTRAVIYLRQSLDATGEGLAIERQRRDCERIVAERRWNLVGTFTDNSVSASGKKRRPQYDVMVKAYQADQFDAVVCWDLDRLTRQPRQLEDWVDAAEGRGLILVTANGEADLSTDGGRMYARIKAAVAKAEVERKSARQQRAALQRSELGRPPLGVRLTGYTPKGDLVEDEAELVRWMFRTFAAGNSLKGIARTLNERGHTTRHGGPWVSSSVATILRNPRYAGRAVYQGKATGREGGWEPLVDGATFDLIQSKLADPRRKTSKVGTDRKHLGSTLFRCGVCDGLIGSWSGNRYRCANACVTRAREAIDDLVTGVIRARLAQPDLANLLTGKETGDAKALAAEIKALRARIVAVEDDYDNGVIDGRRYRVALDKAALALDEALARQVRMSGDSTAAGVVLAQNPVAAFDSAPLMIQRAVVATLLTVRLFPAPRGRRTFDESTVEVVWNAA